MIGPIAATAIIALALPIETFRKGRDFAAWLGLAPRQHSTGGKQRLGSISKMGERTIRRLLIIGGSSMVRQACRFGALAGSWLERVLARKPRMLVSVGGRPTSMTHSAATADVCPVRRRAWKRSFVAGNYGVAMLNQALGSPAPHRLSVAPTAPWEAMVDAFAHVRRRL